MKDTLLHNIILGLLVFILSANIAYFASKFNEMQDEQKQQTELLQRYLITIDINSGRIAKLEDSVFGYNNAYLLNFNKHSISSKNSSSNNIFLTNLELSALRPKDQEDIKNPK